MYLFVRGLDTCAFSALTLLVGRQEKKTEWWGAGMVICLERGVDLHTVQLMPLPVTVSCFSKIQIGFTFLVPAHPGSPGQRAVKRLCVCVCVCVFGHIVDNTVEENCSVFSLIPVHWKPSARARGWQNFAPTKCSGS